MLSIHLTHLSTIDLIQGGGEGRERGTQTKKRAPQHTTPKEQQKPKQTHTHKTPREDIIQPFLIYPQTNAE